MPPILITQMVLRVPMLSTLTTQLFLCDPLLLGHSLRPLIEKRRKISTRKADAKLRLATGYMEMVMQLANKGFFVLLRYIHTHTYNEPKYASLGRASPGVFFIFAEDIFTVVMDTFY
jgi:hypothetical protein